MAGVPIFTRDFSFTSVPLPTCFSKGTTIFYHILTSPNIVHEGCKFSHHWRTSLWPPVSLWGSTKWPNLLTAEFALRYNQAASTEGNVRKWATETIPTGLV